MCNMADLIHNARLLVVASADRTSMRNIALTYTQRRDREVASRNRARL